MALYAIEVRETFSRVRVGVESDGYLAPQAFSPEGRLLIAVIERCFLDACIHRRALLALQAGTPWISHFYHGGASDESYSSNHRRLLGECDLWIADDASYPISLRWACEWLAAGDPEPLMHAFRRAYAVVREHADLKPYKARAGVQ